MDEIILNFINNTNNEYSIKEIKSALHLEHIGNDNIKKILYELSVKGLIFYNEENNTYCSLGEKYKTVDVLCSSRGTRYFIDEFNRKIDLNNNHLNGALNFSKVIVEKREYGYVVVKVLEHRHNKIVCEVRTKGDNKYLVPLDLPINYSVRISKQDMKKLADGDRILVEIPNLNTSSNLDGNFKKIICHRNEPSKELLSIAYSKDFEPDFSDEALKELENIDDYVHPEEIEGRVDLRDEVIFTIDGINTKDMDDAISLKILENGNYQLGVHIADVSHYVKPGMKLFEEAQERGTSLYMIDSVIPMLPQKLSNGICSLNPEVDRLTKSCIMEFDKKGTLIDSKIVNSVIRSKKKMDYDSVNLLLEDGIIKEGYEEYYEQLKLMGKLSEIFTNIRTGKGKIDFASNEIQVKVNDQGKPVNFNLVHQGLAEKLIENFMIAANETVASYFPQLPFVYRVHGIPDEIKIDETVKFLTSLGYRLNLCGNIGSPKLIQNILNSLKEEEEYPLLSNILLRSMKKAEYNIDNIGHFGLASDYYTHFTSPIRRFPDLQVHTLINLYMDNLSNVNLKNLEKDLIKTCAHSSYKERQADSAESTSRDLMMAIYMNEHIGEEFYGIVTNNENVNMKVKTLDHINGKVCLLENTKNNKEKFKIGTHVLLKVENVSLQDRTVYFSIIRRLDNSEMEKIRQKTLKK